MVTLALAWFVVVGQQPAQVGTAVTGAGQHVEDHLVGDVEAGVQRLGTAADHLVERLLVPVGVAPLRWFLLYQLLLPGRVGCHLGLGSAVLDPVHGSLGPDVPFVVEASATGTPRDL